MVEVLPVATIAGAFMVNPEVHTDDRGLFVETYRRQWFPSGREMVQSNRADRRSGCVVGLHYHLFQADYWCVSFGAARVVLHDLRVGSPTDGNTWTIDVGSGSVPGRVAHAGVYIPPGVAHGFSALMDCTLTYLVDGYYNPDDELGVAWNDPEIGVCWGVESPILSERDRANPHRADIEMSLRPRWGEF